MLKEYTDENDSPEDIELLILLLQKVLIKNLLQPTGKSFLFNKLKCLLKLSVCFQKLEIFKM